MPRALTLAALAPLLLTACAHTARTTPAPAPAVVPRRPALQDDFLDQLVGDWLLTRQVRGKTVHNTMQGRWVLAHQFVQLHMLDTAAPPTYEALVLLGYDQDKSQYLAHWCDSYGGAYSADGRGTRAGNTIEFRFDYPDAPFFNTFTWHPETATWTFRGENGQPDGSRKLFMQDTASRR